MPELKNMENPKISIILPCRNEEKALNFCLTEIEKTIKENNLDAEVIVSDSSWDNSPEIAKKHSVILAKHDQEGYGIAYIEGFKNARGKYIFMADSDGSYSFDSIPDFIKELEQGNDLVLGNRFSGKIEKGAMPFLHRYLGNPLLSLVMRIFFKSKIKDAHCGARAIRKSFLEKLNLKTTGMEFASEMIIKSIRQGGKIKEMPITYRKRIGDSKLKSLPDGWRHLKFMLLYSPYYLFFLPGLIFFILGIASLTWLYLDNPEFLGITFYIHPMFIASLLVVLGYQLIIFSIFAKTYSVIHLEEKDHKIENLYKYLTIEKGILAGSIIGFLGLLILLMILVKWIQTELGSMEEIKNSIIASTLIIVGFQTIFSSFMLSILSITKK